MELWLDTANIDEIREGHAWGVIAGVTTNPTLAAKENLDFRQMIEEIAAMVDPGPVSAECVCMARDEIVTEGRELARIAPNVIVKVPCMPEGLAATHALAAEGVRVNMTLSFTPNQCLLAALAGAAYVSPFLGRLDDIGEDSVRSLGDICDIFTIHSIDCKVIAASVRHPMHVTEAALAGADVATIPFKVLQQMVKHPLTDKGISTFLEDWKKVQK
ncbi:MAG: fructose-6-phosphate aldolase [Actinobacteria bacterium]|nr:MAG: fructose-6-phosphate aldolase [Actinomycetota bacterium]